MLTPTSEEELADTIASAKEPLSIRGGGTRGLATDGEPLTTAALSGIKLYEPGALTIVAKAGTPVAEIESALAAENQMLAFEPPDPRVLHGTAGEPTIGGVVATNASGPRRVQAGACRDFLLGVRFVDGSGTILKNGGRVMKNVTGYDLSRLMCGAHGTLGVLSEVSLKVLPRPEAAATLMIYGPAGADAVALMARALTSPYTVSGAAHVSQGDAGHPVTFLRIEGFAAQVSYRMGRLRDLLAPMVPEGPGFGLAEVTDPDKVRLQWKSLRDLDEEGESGTDIWRLSVKPSDAPAVCDRLPGDARYMLNWGGGLIRVFAAPGTDIRAALGDTPGHATLMRGDGNGPRFHPEPEPLARLAADLRARFDPKGILNPGLMG